MRNYLIYLGLLILLLSPFSCENEIKNKGFIDKLSSIENGLPSPYFNYYLYFKIFLENLIAQKETIKIVDVKKYSKEDYFLNISKDEEDIQRRGLEDIEKTYLEEIKEQTFIFIPKNLKPTQIRTVLYKMFINGYIISPNDLVGYYNIKKYKDGDFK